MWYKVNWSALVMQLSLRDFRKPFVLNFALVFIRPLITLNYTWSNWRIENLYKIENTGQVCSLRGSLNDRFDPSLRRIYIGDGQQNPTTYVHTEAEEQLLFTNTEGEDDDETIYVYTEAETADTGLDFIVYVPTAIATAERYALIAHIEFYKAGGKRYAIIQF